jgi:anti-repressor protein
MNGLPELIKKEDGKIAVSAKELYLSLGFDKTQWSRWSKMNIIENEFAIENEDWVVFDMMSKTSEEGGRPSTDFILTINFAKKLAMMAKTEKGERIREYFIACEEEAMKPKPKEISRRELALMVIQLEDEKEAKQLVIDTQQNQLVEQQPKVDFANKLLKSKDCILVREFAKVLTDEGFNIGEKRLYDWFRKNGYLSYTKNEPFQQYMKYFNIKESVVDTVSGIKTFRTPLITPEGQLYFFYKIMGEYKPLFDKTA